MKTELLESAVQDERILPVLKAAYSLEEISGFDLANLSDDINEILKYDLFEDSAPNIVSEDIALIARVVAESAIYGVKYTNKRNSEENSDTIERLKFLNVVEVQNKLFGKLVYGAEDKDRAFEKYYKELLYFDAIAFRKVVKHLLENKENNVEQFKEISNAFLAIPEYLNKRNHYSRKRKELLSVEGTASDKQSLFNTLDASRTNSHNEVIELCNIINEYASKNNISKPYIHAGRFDPSNQEDRAKVAEILVKQEPLIASLYYISLEAKK